MAGALAVAHAGSGPPAGHGTYPGTVTKPLRPPPPPLEARDELVTAIITAAWVVALAVLAVLRERLPAGERWWLWTCAAGLGMGLFGLWYVPRMKRARSRSAARRDQARAPKAPAGPTA